MKTAVHYNFALRPERNKLPACQVGGKGRGNDFSGWRVTVDRCQVTCRKCLKAMGATKKQPV